MAGTANISSTFSITFVPSDANATVITNPGRAFRITAIAVNNPTVGAHNFTLTDGVGNITQGGAFSAAANQTSMADLDTTRVEITAAENLTATAAAGITSVEIICVATGGGQALTAT